MPRRGHGVAERLQRGTLQTQFPVGQVQTVIDAQPIPVCQLSTGLSAVAQLQVSLGVSPLELGFPATRALLGANLSATAAALADVGVSLSTDLSASLAAGMPSLPGTPGFATSAAVQAALSLDTAAFASLTVSADVSPMLTVGLSSSALAANLAAALAITASARPCPVCDSRAIMASLSIGA
jgi:hypothetical protein